MKRFIRVLLTEDSGQDLVEYALVAGMVAMAAVASMPTLTTEVSTVFSKIGSIVTSAMGS